MNLYLACILLYSALLIGLGAWFSRRVKFASEFLVARRSLGAGLIFATFLAANIGAGSTVNAAALGYRMGWSAWWWVGAAGLGCLILANTVGPRIWYWAKAENFATLGDYLEYRYDRSVRGWIAVILWGGTVGLLADHDITFLGPQDVHRLGAIRGNPVFGAGLDQPLPQGKAMIGRYVDLV